MTAVAFLLLLLPYIIAGDVVTLTDANFDEQIAQGTTWFIKFYAPWCGHCKAMASTWDELAADLQSNPDVRVAKIDATVETNLASRFGVNGFPTLKLIHKNSVFEYEGERSLPSFKEFATGGFQSRSGQPLPKVGASDVIHLNDTDFETQVTALKNDSEQIWFVEFYAPWCGACKALKQTWESLAATYKDSEDIRIAAVDAVASTKLQSRFAINGYPTLFLFKQGRYYTFNGARSFEKLKQWVEGGYTQNRSFAVPPADPKQLKEDIVEPESDVIVLHDDDFESQVQMGFEEPWFIEFYAVWCGHCKSLKPVWEMLATNLKGKRKVAKIEANQNPKAAKRLSVAGFPTLVIIHQGLYYDYSGARTLGALTEFAMGGYKNTTGAVIASDASKPSEVIDLDDSNFEHLTQSVTGGTTGDWFILFYSEWCKPCIFIKPVWNFVAQNLKGVVNVAAIDALNNFETTTRFGVTSFPTMLLLSHGKVYRYNGTREGPDLIAFATKTGETFEGTKEFSIPPLLGTSERLQIFVGVLLQEAYDSFQYNPLVAGSLWLTGLISGIVLSLAGARLLCKGKSKADKEKSS